MKKIWKIAAIIILITAFYGCSKNNDDSIVNNDEITLTYIQTLKLNNQDFVKINVLNKTATDFTLTINNVKVDQIITMDNKLDYFIKSKHEINILLPIQAKLIYNYNLDDIDISVSYLEKHQDIKLLDTHPIFDNYTQASNDIYYQVDDDYLYFLIVNNHKITNVTLDDNILDNFKIVNNSNDFKAYRYNLDFISTNKTYSSFKFYVGEREVVIK